MYSSETSPLCPQTALANITRRRSSPIRTCKLTLSKHATTCIATSPRHSKARRSAWLCKTRLKSNQLTQCRKLITQSNQSNHYQSSHRRCKEQIHSQILLAKQCTSVNIFTMPAATLNRNSREDASIELVISPARSYARRIFRRSPPASPNSPDPNSIRLEGSGTADGSPTKFCGG